MGTLHKPGQAAPAARGQLAPEAFPELAVLFRKQWKRYRQALDRCRRRFSETAVHQLRVEARRLLSMLDLLSPILGERLYQQFRTALKRYLDNFDDLRDTHVQLGIAKSFGGRFAAARLLRKQLRKREQRAAKRARKHIRHLGGLRRLDETMEAARQRLKAWEKQGSAAKGSRILLGRVRTAFAETRELLNAVDASRPKTIHRTRVAFKKFRYMVEILSPYLPLVRPAGLEAMRRYQTVMGEIQDFEVFLGGFDKLARKAEVEPEPAQRFRRSLEAKRDRLVDRFLAQAGELDSFWPPPARAGIQDRTTSRGAHGAPA